MNITNRILDGIEAAGNRLPHPFWLFCGLFLVVGLGSAALSGTRVQQAETQLLVEMADGERQLGRPIADPSSPIDLSTVPISSRLRDLHVELWSGAERVAVLPVTRGDLAVIDASALDKAPEPRIRLVNRPAEVEVRSLVGQAGLAWLVLNLVENFAHFEPLGLVLVMLMGVAIAEGTGLVAITMRSIVAVVPQWAVTPVLFALAACGNIGSDAGIVVIPPLAAAIYKQLGRNPIAGLLVGYVGATAGFTANLLPAGTDVLAMALTNAATGGQPEVNVFCNIYFMAASVFFLAAVGTFVTHRYTLPRLGALEGDAGSHEVEAIQPQEWRGLGVAWAAVLLLSAVWLLTILPEGGWLRNSDPSPGMFWRSPFFKGLVPILFTLFVAGGIVYGRVAGTLTKADELIEHMTGSMKRMGGYIVLILVIAQFIRAFQWAHLDQVVAVQGADLLRAAGMEQYPVPFFVAFIGVIAVSNLFMGSASAKWAIFAPIFVPMFMSVGLHPAFTQLLYRMGDSITNCVSPLYPFFPVLIGWIAEYDEGRTGVGTVLSYLVPYAFWLMVGWLIMLIGWYAMGWPIGPNSPIFL